MVVGLDYTDATLSVHDLLQELKTHPFVRGILAGGTRVAWGAKTIPEGGFQALPDRLSFPGGMVVGDSAGFVNVPGAQGRPLRDEVRAPGGRGRGRRGRARGDRRGRRERSSGYDEAVRDSYVWSDLHRVRNARPAFSKGFYRGALVAGVSITTLGKLPPRHEEARAGRRRAGRRRRAARAPTRPPTDSSSSTSSRASTSPATRPATTPRATSG